MKASVIEQPKNASKNGLINMILSAPEGKTMMHNLCNIVKNEMSVELFEYKLQKLIDRIYTQPNEVKLR